jgi:transposase
MGHSYGVHRHEVIRCPERLDDSIAEDTPVRFLAACVDALDLAAYGFRRALPAATGRPGSAPGDLWKRSLYGDLSRRRSSRRLEQEGQRTVELLWLLKQLRPDHTTMAHCRQNTLAPLRHVCRPGTLLCQQLPLFGAALVASAGSKGRAVNAKERNCPQDKLTKRLVQIDAPIAASLKELDRRDTEEDRGTGGGAHAAALAAKIAARTQRKLRSEGLQAQRRSPSQEQRALTAPESRAMQRGTGRGTQGCDKRFLRVIYVPDPEPDSIFVITAYELRGKPLTAYRRRQRRKGP